MEIKTSRQIFDMEDFNSMLTGIEGQNQYVKYMDKKWVCLKSIKKLIKDCISNKNGKEMDDLIEFIEEK